MSFTLSGLDDRITRLEVQQLLTPSTSEIKTLSNTVTSQYNNISNSDNVQDQQISQLIQGFAALKGSLNSLETLFYSHTGNTDIHI